MFHDHPGKIFAARKDSPLIIGKSQTDVSSHRMFRQFLIRQGIYTISETMRLRSFLRMRSIFIISTEKRSRRNRLRSSGMRSRQKRAEYEHFMLKEIHEQPRAVRDTIGAYVKDGKIDLSRNRTYR